MECVAGSSKSQAPKLYWESKVLCGLYPILCLIYQKFYELDNYLKDVRLESTKVIFTFNITPNIYQSFLVNCTIYILNEK